MRPRPSPLRDVTFAGGAVRLAGVLGLPGAGVPARAGVVLVGGSGPTDRDNDTFFPPLRRHLLDAGIAVLSYDKRGVGASSGDWRDSTLTDLAADASAALGFLRSASGVRADTVGLFGHSEGGWVVLRAASGRDDVPWVVTTGCPAVSPAAQERHALAVRLRKTGTGNRDALALYDRLVEAGRSGADFATARRLVEAAGAPPELDPFWAGMDERLWTFVRRKQDHDPAADLHRLRCPHLAVFGGDDPLVPVADSLRVLGAAACRADRPRRAALTVEVVPGADHRVRMPGSASMAPGCLDTVTRWIHGA